MKRGRRALLLLVGLIFLCLIFLDRALVYAQVPDRAISKTGPATATNNVPFDYTITLTIPPFAGIPFVFTDTLAVGGPGGTIGYELLECPLPPCPPNPTGDIPILSESPITGTLPVGGTQAIQFTVSGAMTTTLTTTYLVLMRVTPNFTAGGVITNTVTLPPDSNPSNDSAVVVTQVGQLLSETAAIPTLRDWGMVIMVVLFGGTALYFMKRRKSAQT